MKRLANYVMVGSLVGIVATHTTTCALCYDYIKDQGYSTGTCAAASTVYTGLISQPLAMLGVAAGGSAGLALGAIDYIIRKRREDKTIDDKINEEE